MTVDRRYIASEEHFKGLAHEALESQFASREEFETYYSEIGDEDAKNVFLRVSSFYLFLAKKGGWQVPVAGSASEIGYLSVSYKLVALFSLIESLSTEHFVEFYEWLLAKERVGAFPISSKKRLAELYSEYKASFGSTKKCVAFFKELPVSRQRQLCNSIEIDGKALATTKRLAQFLYNLRSGFVHEGRLVHAVGGGSVMYKQGEKLVHARLELDSLLLAFEEGLVAHFRRET